MATIFLILQMLPTIIQIVVAIENVFKGLNIQGPAKKQVVLDALAGNDPKTVVVVSSLVDKVVGSFNKTGVFTHGIPETPATEPTVTRSASTGLPTFTSAGTPSGSP